jgi:RHS repeat-associated protein
MEIGLYDYNGRYYAPTLGYFLSPDTLIPDQKQRYTIQEKAGKLKC